MTSFDPKKFEKSIPSIIKDSIKVFETQGFLPIVVGGIVRDFLLTGNLGQDWDFEVHHPSLPFNKDLWKEMGKELGRLGRVSFLNFEVIRLETQSYQIEFSPPRKETFVEDWQTRGHSNFIADFDFRLNFDESVMRRDFTINSIGVGFSNHSAHLLDPLGGVLHLRDKILHPAGPDFEKDPVRFFRALRFSLKFNFQISSDLEKKLIGMPVQTVSSSYLWSEMNKSGDPIEYLDMLLRWHHHHPQLLLPIDERYLTKKADLKSIVKEANRHEMWMIALEWVGLSSQTWQEYFGLSMELSKRFSRWANLSREFQMLKPESFHGEFAEVLKDKRFEFLFDWYFTTKQLLQKNPHLPLIAMIETWLPEWIYLYRFEVLKDVKHIDPPLRAKYQVWNLCQRL